MLDKFKLAYGFAFLQNFLMARCAASTNCSRHCTLNFDALDAAGTEDCGIKTANLARTLVFLTFCINDKVCIMHNKYSSEILNNVVIGELES